MSEQLDRVAITTNDNPFNPFDQFIDWFLFDVEKGYNSCGLLGRIAQTSDSLSDTENAHIVESAIDQIIKYDFMNQYKKVHESDYKTGTTPS